MKTDESNNYKKEIIKHIEALETELATVGEKNPDRPADWEAKGSSHEEVNWQDSGEVADEIEEYDENAAILEQLETDLNAHREALIRIEDGTYGVCSVCSSEIEKGRLNANPAANTCIAHRDQKQG